MQYAHFPEQWYSGKRVAATAVALQKKKKNVRSKKPNRNGIKIKTYRFKKNNTR